MRCTKVGGFTSFLYGVRGRASARDKGASIEAGTVGAREAGLRVHVEGAATTMHGQASHQRRLPPQLHRHLLLVIVVIINMNKTSIIIAIIIDFFIVILMMMMAIGGKSRMAHWACTWLFHRLRMTDSYV